ncbi:MAG: amidohydrolase, partial [Pygmaiobacter sp.]
NVGVNYLREHMEPTDRIHYAVTDTGGISPNVVQNHAEVLYLVRSTETEKVKKLYERVCDVARGAALMTGCQLEIAFDKACSNILSNSVLEQLLYDSMTEVALPQYSPEDLEYAARFQETVSTQDIAGDLSLMALGGMEKNDAVMRYAAKPMVDFVLQHRHLDINIPGSSDVGDASHVVPTAQFVAACYVPGTPAHSWQMVAQGKSDIAVKGMLYAARVLANAAQKIVDDPEIVQKAKNEFTKSMGGHAYECPIPATVKPNSNAK